MEIWSGIVIVNKSLSVLYNVVDQLAEWCPDLKFKLNVDMLEVQIRWNEETGRPLNEKTIL